MVVGLESMLSNLWISTQNAIPSVLAAAITLIIGFIVGKLLGKVVKEVLVRSNVDSYISETEHMSIKVSTIGSLLVRWIIYLVFIQQAAVFLGVSTITEFIGFVITYISQVVFAATTIIIGYAIAIYLKDKVITAKTVYSDIMGKAVFFLVIYLSIALGLKFITVLNTTIIDYLLLIIVASVGLGMAIALGLGLKDVVSAAAKEYLKKPRRK